MISFKTINTAVNLNNLRFNLIILILLMFSFSGCAAFKPSKTEAPTNALERARKNVEEGKGISMGNILGGRNTNYEFNTSNPLWRSSLETIDFLPLTVVDYSGGIIVTDWYNADGEDSLKISIRFLSNEIRADSLQITIHQKKCSIDMNCKINILESKIKDELVSSIIKKAAILEKEKK